MDGAEILYGLLTEPVFLAVAGGLLLVFAIVALVVLRRLYRRARTLVGSQRHLIDRARVEVAARSLPAGPQREAAELRRRLGQAVTATDRQLTAAEAQPLVSATVAEQHHELKRLAATLDAHLRHLQGDPDPARVSAALPEAAAWTEQLCEVAAELRAAVRESVQATTAGDVRALGTSAADGVAGLRAGIDYLQAQIRSRRP
ncbi:MAG TPA: hypothetical protein VD813_14845 [Pseudonocardia sp.]|nr:hypothetical protein [Pseudonocardia sp.]